MTVSDAALVDGDSDEVQLTVQGHTTQTNDLVVFEQSDGTDVVTVDITGTVTAAGDAVVGRNIYLDDGVWNGIQDGNLVMGDSNDSGIMWFEDKMCFILKED